MTNRTSGIKGSVTDRTGRTVPISTVVVFPEDRERWRSPSRLLRGTRPLQNGQYRVDNLPPGNYRAIAIESLAYDAWTDPGVLERLWPLATSFRLGEGEERTLSLKLASTPAGIPTER